ncbi:MAG: hypothetical protein ABSB76_30430 [Streptosporangiaceae bacterium]|jgi:hypothetical protein
MRIEEADMPLVGVGHLTMLDTAVTLDEFPDRRGDGLGQFFGELSPQRTV